MVKVINGTNVLHKTYKKGTIIEVDDNIKVNFSGTSKKFSLDAFYTGYLKFEDEELQKEVEKEINNMKSATISAKEEVKDKSKTVKSNKKVGIEEMFDKEYHVEHFSKDKVYTYQQVEKLFGIHLIYSGRGINITDDCIVLISKVDKLNHRYACHDHWTADGDFIYTGEGSKGDQSLTKGNKEIVESKNDEKPIYLFIKLSSTEYYYQGQFVLVDHSLEEGFDRDGIIRKEYKFRLRKINRDLEFNNIYDTDLANAHIYLEWDRGYHSFDIIDKHESHLVINDRDCTITYTANRMKCDSVSKVLNDDNYRDLINLFTRYKSVLSRSTTSSWTLCPHGGVGSYKYKFEDVENYVGVAFLFEGNRVLVDNALDEYVRVINNIYNQ